MFKKMLPWLTMILIVITLLVIGGFVLWNFIMNDDAAPATPNDKINDIAKQVEAQPLTAKEREELTFNILDVTTNLADINYLVKISFSLVADSHSARQEVEMIEPIILDIIGNILSDTTPDEIKGSVGKDNLKTKIINRVNPRLNDGNLREINISDFIISQR